MTSGHSKCMAEGEVPIVNAVDLFNLFSFSIFLWTYLSCFSNKVLEKKTYFFLHALKDVGSQLKRILIIFFFF